MCSTSVMLITLQSPNAARRFMIVKKANYENFYSFVTLHFFLNVFGDIL